MIYLILISIFSWFLSIVAKQSSTFPASNDSGPEFKIIVALIVAIVLIITILVIVIIILFALSGKSKKHHKLPKLAQRKTPEENKNHVNNNKVFVAKGQSVNEKAKNEVGASGSFIFSGHSSDKPIPIEETYATALQNTEASESGIYEKRPIDLNFNKPSNSKSVLIKDNKSVL